MAGRPTNPKEREKKKCEVDTAIDSLQKRGIPVTRKSLADELGISVQNFYAGKNSKLGYVAQYVESLGVLKKFDTSQPLDFEAEVKRLKNDNERLKKDNARLREKDKLSQATIKCKEEMIDTLKIKLEDFNGKKFEEQKRKFISSRI